MLNDDIKSAIKASGLDVEVSTKANIQLIIDYIDVEYGGWSDLRRTRNYDEMKRIANFTSIESTNAGLDRLQLLIEERISWRDATQLYTDKFHESWLPLRMKNWGQLSLGRNVFVVTESALCSLIFYYFELVIF